MEPWPPLPIVSVLTELRRRLDEAASAVLTAPPGAGKTTIVPLALRSAPWLQGRRILMLEPRRLAARAAASRMAALLQEAVGETVGYRTRFDTRITDRTRIEVVTEGILTRLLQEDPSLHGVGLVIFDEFHERSLQADMGLALTLDARRILRPDLRVLIMSATLDVAGVAHVLGEAPVVGCEGRLFPVDVHYRDRRLAGRWEEAVGQAIHAALIRHTGSVLVFLPGMAEIRRLARWLDAARLPSDVMVLPLHGDLPIPTQDAALAPAPDGQRKVVLSSAIAETSVTIDGIEVVIDGGLMRIPRFDPRTGLTRLETLRVTRDAADQRCGRAGRLGPGVCYRLWTLAEQQGMLARRQPEILEADLASLVLELAVWGTTEPSTLAWLDAPPSPAVAHARTLLIRLGALDARGAVTAEGRRMVQLPLHPRLAHMVHRAVGQGLGPLACEVAALLGERDLLRGPPGWRNADLRLRLDSLHGTLREPGVTVEEGTRRRIQQAAQQIATLLARDGRSAPVVPPSAAMTQLGVVFSWAYPDRIAQRQPGEEPRYRLVNGRGAHFPHPEPLSGEPYLVIADLGGGDEWARIDLAVPIAGGDLMSRWREQIIEERIVTWDDRAKGVQARLQQRLGALILRDQPLSDPDPERVLDLLLEGVRREGVQSLPWTPELRQWQARLMLLRRCEGTAWPDVSDEGLMGRLAEWLGPMLRGMTRLDQVQRVNFADALRALLTWEQRHRLDRLAPTHVTVPSGSRIRLDYTQGDQPVLAVRVQEMFGCPDTPTVVQGKVSVVVHLLSPAGRPVQVTQDLKGFWTSSYQQVRKELRARYPKHSWPEDPWQAAPTARPTRRRRE